MKTNIVLLALISTLSLAHAGGRTTGGGDYSTQITDLLPKSVTVEMDCDITGQSRFVVGKRNVFGLFPVDAHASVLRTRYTLTRDALLSEEPLVENLTVTAYRHPGKSSEQKLSLFGPHADVVGKWYDSLIGIVNSDHVRFELAPGCYDRMSYEVVIPGQSMTTSGEVEAMLKNLAIQISEVVDYSNVNDIQSLAVLIRLTSVIPKISERPVFDVLKAGYLKALSSKVSELMALARSVTNEETYECDQDRYQELLIKSHPKNFKIAQGRTAEAMVRILRFDSVAVEARNARNSLHDYIEENVEPFCEDHSSQKAKLKLILDQTNSEDETE